jgi:polyhydroxyalkanoate synthesis regulator phasin
MSRNVELKQSLKSLKPNVRRVTANKIPEYNTKNIQGYDAYKLDKWLRLLSILNTSKVEPQFYRSASQTLTELQTLINECGKENAYLTAQCIVYSRCVGEGLRTINQVAAVLLAPHLAGRDFAKRFYSLWDKKAKKGGTIYRADDMSNIVEIFSSINKVPLTNAMRRGFRNALERLDAHSLLKYKNDIFNIIRLTHPNPNNGVKVYANEGSISVLSAIRNGLNLSADTWETSNSEAGQLVATAVKEGKIDKQQASTILSDAKADNWKGLLKEGKLGILAALRNIRSIVSVAKNDTEVIAILCNLISNGELIRKGKIFPYQIDIAYEVVKDELGDTMTGRQIAKALLTGYESAIPNLSELLTGRTAVFIDVSASMWGYGGYIYNTYNQKKANTSAGDKACLIAATIAKATNADLYQFGGTARKAIWDINSNVFALSEGLKANLGSTNLASAFRLAEQLKEKYDRIIILSDNECNRGSNKEAYKSYVGNIGNPYIYSVDLAAYGTAPIAGDRVRYYFGYGYQMFEDISSAEFKPDLEKVKKIVI